MSITSIASSLFQPSITQNVQNKFQQVQSQFQQLGQDLKAGNLSQAQQDFATLTQNLPGGQQQNATGPLAQAFNLLGQDLKAGNLGGAERFHHHSTGCPAAVWADTTSPPSSRQRRRGFEFCFRTARQSGLAGSWSAGTGAAIWKPLVRPAGVCHAAAGSAAVPAGRRRGRQR